VVVVHSILFMAAARRLFTAAAAVAGEAYVVGPAAATGHISWYIVSKYRCANRKEVLVTVCYYYIME
jgi:hypothetical protein